MNTTTTTTRTTDSTRLGRTEARSTRRSFATRLARGGATALAATLLAAPAAHAQQQSSWPNNAVCPSSASSYCGAAETALSTFVGAYKGNQLAFGENPFREQSAAGFGGGGMTWHDASTVEMLVDYYAATGDAQFNSIVAAYQGFDALDNFGGGGAGSNGYNDDKLWWALAFLRAYEKLPDHNAAYLTNAKGIFQNVCAQWNAVPGCQAGLPQTQGGDYLNSITNELFFQTAMRLYSDDPGGGACTGAVPWTGYPASTPKYPGAPGGLSSQFENDYLGWAMAEYEWLRGAGQPTLVAPAGQLWVSSPIADGMSNCSGGGTAWTYNSGPILGALLDFAASPQGVDPQANVLNLAEEVANEGITYFAPNGILEEVGLPGCTNNIDCPQFKGIFARYLSRLAYQTQATSSFNAEAETFLANNASSIVAHTIQTTVPVSCNTDLNFAYSCKGATGASLPLDWAASGGLSGANYQAAMTSALDGIIAAIPTKGPLPPAPPASSSPSIACTHTLGCEGSVIVTCTAPSTGAPIEVSLVASSAADPSINEGSFVLPTTQGTYTAAITDVDGPGWLTVCSAGVCNAPVAISPDLAACSSGGGRGGGGGGGGGGYQGPSGCVGHCIE